MPRINPVTPATTLNQHSKHQGCCHFNSKKHPEEMKKLYLSSPCNFACRSKRTIPEVPATNMHRPPLQTGRMTPIGLHSSQGHAAAGTRNCNLYSSATVLLPTTSVLVTTSKALVTRSDPLVTNSFFATVQGSHRSTRNGTGVHKTSYVLRISLSPA